MRIKIKSTLILFRLCIWNQHFPIQMRWDRGTCALMLFKNLESFSKLIYVQFKIHSSSFQLSLFRHGLCFSLDVWLNIVFDAIISEMTRFWACFPVFRLYNAIEDLSTPFFWVSKKLLFRYSTFNSRGSLSCREINSNADNEFAFSTRSRAAEWIYKYKNGCWCGSGNGKINNNCLAQLNST